jgi:hypothetical protein
MEDDHGQQRQVRSYRHFHGTFAPELRIRGQKTGKHGTH